jgi:glycosyltransferase involved in cell wall biosynthesis
MLSKEYSGILRLMNRFYFRSLVKTSVTNAERVIAISKFTKTCIMNEFGTPGTKIDVIYLNVEDRYRPLIRNRKTKLAKYGLPNKFILYVGNFNPHKNVPILIKAYSELPPAIKEAYGLVLGGSSRCHELASLAKELGIEKNVRFTGFVPENDLPVIYSAATVFVFPSLHEGFGLPPLEAMACGTPVIVSDAASLPEVVGDAGILIKPTDTKALSKAIINVLNDNDMQITLKKKGLLKAKVFTPHKTASEFLATISKVMSLN